MCEEGIPGADREFVARQAAVRFDAAGGRDVTVERPPVIAAGSREG